MITNTYNWDSQLNNGALGVELFIPWFKNRSYSDGENSVINVEKDPNYQKLGIDLLLKATWRKEPIKVDVKTDFKASLSRNFFFETMSSKENKTPGWLYTSQAEFIIYVVIEKYTKRSDETYILRLSDIRNFFEKNSYKYSPRNTSSIRDGRTWTTEGYPIPIEHIQHYWIEHIQHYWIIHNIGAKDSSVEEF